MRPSSDKQDTSRLRAQAAAIAAAMRAARSILVITGAGISAESGLPTYRGIGGLYDDQLTDDAMPIEVALSGQMLRERPDVTWKYIGQIERACRGARHSAAHQMLARWERTLAPLWVLTQNIDGFHRAAGSTRLIEMHGDIHWLDCQRCGHAEHVQDYACVQLPPGCERCGGPARPRVVLFGEALPQPALRDYERMLAARPDVVISIGTTSVFPYIAHPVLAAPRWGGMTVEINPGESDVSHRVHHRMQATAGVALAAINVALEAAQPEPGQQSGPQTVHG